MIRTLCTALVAMGAFQLHAAENQLTNYEQRSGWKLIFDGQSTKGWRNYQQQTVSDGWSVEDGVLTRNKAKAGDLITDQQFKFFELQLEYRISKGGNSGLMFHVTEDGKKAWHSGPEIQIQDNVEGHDAQKAGWLYQLYKPVKPGWAIHFEQQVGFTSPDVSDATRPAGEWNHIYLRISPHQSEVIVNGVSYYYFQLGSDDWNERVAASKFAKFPQFGKAGQGHICLQDHGNVVSFRNIKIRELPDDGKVKDPVDGKLALRSKVAFPNLKWDGWEPLDDRGRPVKRRPMVLTHAGDNSGRIFVATQGGVIYCFAGQANVEKSHRFLDISEQVQDWQKDAEEGLLGLAFHPDFKNNGYFYLYYTSSEEPRMSIVSRFSVSKDDPNLADPESELIIMKMQQPFSNHNGGSILFGNDGYLYIGLGDGGGRNDPLHHGQNLMTLMGSVLRIDVDHQDKDRNKNYSIPRDNPFFERANALPEIYAYGFRNIWRLSIDRPTGRIFVADVGQDLWEEVNVLKSGGNYGWSALEASLPFGNTDARKDGPLVEPIWTYDHQIGKSITGGLVYRGSKLKKLQGMYLYADYVSGKIWALELDEKTHEIKRNLAIADQGNAVISFGEDDDGEVYYLLENSNGKGIYRFERPLQPLIEASSDNR